ncbi:hypothetical protein AB0J21_10660 [Streptomyces sp. NPDC049954]|uniref:hypothetical protein n=1 Tax=Streptomyces sp. NPDC049954 TaxID=3155779 RepID=UPI0034373555
MAARLCGALVALAVCLLGDFPVYEHLLRIWDAPWYQHIAEYGYGAVRRSAHYPHLLYRDVAFFPLYPALIRAFAFLLPLSVPVTALLLSLAAGLLAVWGVHAIGVRLCGRRTALALVTLWVLLPHAVVLSVPYSESLLTACAVWSLYALLTGRWLWAGTLAVLAGLARPNGAAVAAAVCLYGLWVLWSRRRRRASWPEARRHPAPSGLRHPGLPGFPRLTGLPRLPAFLNRPALPRLPAPDALRRLSGWAGTPEPSLRPAAPGPHPGSARIWAGVLLAPLGWTGYVLYVGARQGDPLGGYFAVQDDWGSSFDFGQRMMRLVDRLEIGTTRWIYVIALLVLIGALALFTVLLTRRWAALPGALVVYTGMLMLIAVGGSSYVSCKPRFLLPAFPLLLPAAAFLARTARTRPRAATVFVVVLAGFSAGYGAFLITGASAAL